jgi:hypothetical protein
MDGEPGCGGDAPAEGSADAGPDEIFSAPGVSFSDPDGSLSGKK